MKYSFFSTSVLLIVTVVLLTVGCGKAKPAGMPKLYSTVIVVMQEGKPLSNARVSLYNIDDPQSRWIVSGTSDASGRATVHTETDFKGAPAAKYKVAVAKVERDFVELPSDNATPKEIEEYRKRIKAAPPMERFFVEDAYRNRDTTPIEITVEAKHNEIEIDAGPAVVVEKSLIPF